MQAGPVDGARQVVDGELAFTARIDDGAKAAQLRQRLIGRDTLHAHFKSFRSSGQTLPRIVGCAAAVG